MGFYIDSPVNKGKAEWLVRVHGAEIIFAPALFDYTSDLALICVVENELWDAALIVYNRREYLRALPRIDDDRPRTWLKMSKDKVIELQPHAKEGLLTQELT